MPRYGPPNCIGLPERLSFRHRDIGPQFGGTLQNAQAQRIEHQHQQGAGRVRQIGHRLHFLQAAEEVRMLQHHAGHLVIQYAPASVWGSRRPVGRVDRDQFGAQIDQVRLQDLPVFGMQAARPSRSCP